ncbi:HAMP domain-containing sensor histidine kinase [Haloarcula brevis]|uniref:HAMP domain-containing sensor histidine kinase n=1 Tax=Haloarcula brevis TaxID=3111453 RepID=UPI00300EB7CC
MSPAALPDFAELLDVTLLLHDPETDAILDANAAAESLYGYTRAELRDLTVGDISTESPRFSRDKAVEAIHAAATGDRPAFEWQIRRADSEMRWVTVRLRPFAPADETLVLAEIQDITEFKKRARRLQLLNRIIRHNLRNEMTVVMGHAESLERALEDEDYERQAEIIQDVAEDVGGMTRSVAQIEDIATNDASDFTPTDVPAVLERLADEFESGYPHATVSVDADETARIAADRGFEYGLEHAIENALEHHDGSNPEVRLEATVETEPPRVVVRIVDDGPPIPQREIDAIDADVEFSEIHHGTGVGLFVMQWCAESLGGSLEIRENEPRGNVAEFTVPMLSE